jgi:hypothetical protein
VVGVLLLATQCRLVTCRAWRLRWLRSAARRATRLDDAAAREPGPLRLAELPEAWPLEAAYRDPN